MPAEVRKTGLLNKLAQRVAKAHEAHKGDETKFGIVDLPSGIKGGIARLATCKLDEYKEGKNKGEPYALFRGIAISPAVHDNCPVKGQGVMVMVPLCDTKKMKDGQEVTVTFDEHWADFLNELRKFEINTSAIPPAEAHKIVPEVLAGLERSKPLFRFSTRGWTPPASQRDPNPKEMVFVQYDGVISDTEAAEATKNNPTSGFAAPQGSSGGDGNDAGTTTAADDAPDEGTDLIDLANRAETSDMAAIEEMKDKARALGITEDEIDNSSSWATGDPADGKSLYELMIAKMNGDDNTTEVAPEPEPEPFTPKVGMTCNYQIKTGGKVHQVKVDKIHKDKTCDLSNIADKGKTKYLNQPLSKLSAA